MAKSKMLKEFAQNKIELESLLKQLKLLLVDLGKEELVDWVNYEIEGYPANANLPEYREYPGILKGTFLNYHTQCSNVPIPLKPNSPEVVKECTSKVSFREGVTALKKLQTSNGKISASIPGDLLFSIQKYSAVSMTYLMSADIVVSDTIPNSILSTIENKAMDILILLEKEFGCLDDLSIDISERDEKEIEQIANNITIIINDNHIEMGNDNTIKNSTING